MPALMTGSATIRANTTASSPPAAPASTPRRRSFFSMPGCPAAAGLVAGEAEEMPGVMDELVDVHVVAENRDRALVNADEVIHRQRQQRRGGQPQRSSRQRQDNRPGRGASSRHAVHDAPPWGIARPVNGWVGA